MNKLPDLSYFLESRFVPTLERGGEQFVPLSLLVTNRHAGDPFAHRETLAAAGGIVFDDMRNLSGMIGLA